jgi:hypothetical protein
LNGGGLDVDLCEKTRSTAARDECLNDEVSEKGNENGKIGKKMDNLIKSYMEIFICQLRESD